MLVYRQTAFTLASLIWLANLNSSLKCLSVLYDFNSFLNGSETLPPDRSWTSILPSLLTSTLNISSAVGLRYHSMESRIFCEIQNGSMELIMKWMQLSLSLWAILELILPNYFTFNTFHSKDAKFSNCSDFDDFNQIGWPNTVLNVENVLVVYF